MIYGRKRRRPRRPLATRCWLPIVAMSLLVSMPTHAHESTEPEPPESRPVSPQAARLYTEEEALAAALAAAEAAVDVAVPLAVQAAVAEERGKAAAQQVLDKAAAEVFPKAGIHGTGGLRPSWPREPWPAAGGGTLRGSWGCGGGSCLAGSRSIGHGGEKRANDPKSAHM